MPIFTASAPLTLRAVRIILSEQNPTMQALKYSVQALVTEPGFHHVSHGSQKLVVESQGLSIKVGIC